MSAASIGLTEQEKKDKTLQLAFKEGGKVSAVTLAVVGPLLYYKIKTSASFRSWLGPSGRAAMLISPVLAAGVLRTELVMNRAIRDPLAYGIGSEAALSEEQKGAYAKLQQRKQLAWWQYAANYVYENPVATIVGIGVPAYAGIYMRESKHLPPDTAIANKILHTRVFGQVTMFAVLAGVFLFRQAMGAPYDDGQHHEPKDNQGQMPYEEQKYLSPELRTTTRHRHDKAQPKAQT